MGRSVGVVIAGWLSGFLIAVAWGATRANNPRLASLLSGWAIAGMVVIGVLLASIALTDRAEHRRLAREERRVADTTSAATQATVTEQRVAARIAELEALLAREQEELDATVASLATAELAATGHVTGVVEPIPDRGAAALEPVLRREVVETVARLVGTGGDGQPAVPADVLEALVDKGR